MQLRAAWPGGKELELQVGSLVPVLLIKMNSKWNILRMGMN